MSSIRSDQSLCCTDEIFHNPFANLLSETIRREQVYRLAENRFELRLNVEKSEIANRLAEVDEDVHVAVGPRLVSRDRAEDRERLDPELVDLLAVFCEQA